MLYGIGLGEPFAKKMPARVGGRGGGGENGDCYWAVTFRTEIAASATGKTNIFSAAAATAKPSRFERKKEGRQ